MESKKRECSALDGVACFSKRQALQDETQSLEVFSFLHASNTHAMIKKNHLEWWEGQLHDWVIPVLLNSNMKSRDLRNCVTQILTASTAFTRPPLPETLQPILSLDFGLDFAPVFARDGFLVYHAEQYDEKGIQRGLTAFQPSIASTIQAITIFLENYDGFDDVNFNIQNVELFYFMHALNALLESDVFQWDDVHHTIVEDPSCTWPQHEPLIEFFLGESRHHPNSGIPWDTMSNDDFMRLICIESATNLPQDCWNKALSHFRTGLRPYFELVKDSPTKAHAFPEAFTMSIFFEPRRVQDFLFHWMKAEVNWKFIFAVDDTTSKQDIIGLRKYHITPICFIIETMTSKPPEYKVKFLQRFRRVLEEELHCPTALPILTGVITNAIKRCSFYCKESFR